MNFLDSNGLTEQIRQVKAYVDQSITDAQVTIPAANIKALWEESEAEDSFNITPRADDNKSGIPVGFEYFSMNPNVPQGSLPLLGGTYNRDTYSDLWEWVQQQTGYLKTEAEWQTLSESNNGNVPYYSSGDGSTTFRVPSLHCWIKGSDGSAQLVGSYLAAGLPNITGDFILHAAVEAQNISGANDGEGAITFGFENNQYRNLNTLPLNSGAKSFGQVILDASRSSALYGNANTVQPESIVGMWLVKAYGTIADTGTINEKAYMDEQINTLKTYADTTFVSKQETVTLLGSSTTAEGAVTFGNIANLDYQRYLFTIDIQFSGEDFVRGTAAELSKSALLTNGAHAYNYGSSVAVNWCTLFFIISPSIGVSYWTGGVTNPSSTVTSTTFRVYGIK